MRRAVCLLWVAALSGCHWVFPYGGPPTRDGPLDARPLDRLLDTGAADRGRPPDWPTEWPKGNTYFVSKKAESVHDGKSWGTAWNELGDIDWSTIQPGDSVIIDGGGSDSGMQYETSLIIDGVTGPISVRRSEDAGRNGKITIFGGRGDLLPYCSQQGYTPSSTTLKQGIWISNSSWIMIDGGTWSGIVIRGHTRGVLVEGSAQHVTLRNIEVHDNGSAAGSNGAWRPSGEGVAVAGNDVAIERALIHDNGARGIRVASDGSEVPYSGISLRDSWVYNERKDAANGLIWNECVRPNGVQAWKSQIANPLVEGCVIGPGMIDAVGISETTAVTGGVIRNSLIYGTGQDGHNILLQGSSSTWTLDRITSDRPNLKWHNVSTVANMQITITSSIFTGGQSNYIPASGTFSGNCQLNVSGSVGNTIDPQYQNPGAYGSNSLTADYALKPTSPCLGAGSPVTSSAALVAK